jgi:MraZ protein
MALFLGRHIHRIDRKGRVSVPASFRAALAGQLEQGIVAIPSFKLPAVDCYSMQKLEELSQQVDQLPTFSEERDDFAAALFGSAIQLPLDGEGRIVLPDTILAHAKITEAVAFVGGGKSFTIWEPSAADEFLSKAGVRALAERRVLKAETEWLR